MPVNINDGIVVGAGSVVTKDLKIKGSSQVIKIGTKAVIRRVLDKKDHELDCKVDGIGEMMVTAKFVKKAEFATPSLRMYFLP